VSVALTLDAAADHAISLEEYVDHIARHVDVRDIDSVCASAPMLAALAANRTFLAELLCQELCRWEEFQSDNDYISPSFILHRGKDFFVRANVWTPRVEAPDDRGTQDRVNFYALAHDHNFSFMTVGYWGPGYETALYEVDPSSFEGVVGEPVELRFIERTTLPQGKVMLYRASTDVHEQAPPAELSISLNLMLVPPEASLISQHYFDLETRRIAAVTGLSTQGRVALCRLAGLIGDKTTAALLERLAWTHPTREVRRAAQEALAALTAGAGPPSS
jgi:hypothetical protein